ncbi:Histidine kinase-, DNA gyrase B-, and HSP90-like ATPase [Desulfacinum infernum DSM 9756]|uniref:histidine kinase n=1 Tax=Desulfacinum infernum DSM 9756 TaxID=1121391 RepID=A0A1M5I2N7_9BACT|nr:ATP-binding protein [Desulfacinum infernum]SHG22501.1 Histidine kinase-, DNA gyrase B-, and HSP90-like ATPase [Desulfacinum infernum DSM 9756]
MNPDGFQTVLLLLGHRENRRLLVKELAAFRRCFEPGSWEFLLAGDSEEPPLVLLEGVQNLAAPVDLIVADGPGLAEARQAVLDRKAAEQPRLLPVLLIASKADLGLASSQLWKVVDELLFAPVRRLELQARLAVLLRARSLSVHMERRNQDLKAFVYMMAHDLRAPARAVEGLAEALVEDFGTNLGGGLEYVTRMRDAASEMGRLMDAALDFVKLESRAPILAPVDPEAAARRVLRRLRPQIDQSQARVSLQEGPWPKVLGVEEFLVSVLHNLVGNALKYVPPNVPPRVEIGWEETPSILTRLYVRDRGIGIPAEKREAIFSPFRRLHSREEYEGLGLGLTAAQRMVHLMHGRLSVQSEPGVGSTFFVELVRCDDAEIPVGG